MVEDADVSLILISPKVEGFPTTRAEMIDVQRFDASTYPTDAPATRATPDDALYVTYTSGSTGRPNGVVGTHRGAINRFNWAWETYPFSEGETCCQKTSLNYLDHLAETWAPLLTGHPLVVIPDEVVQDGARFVDLLAEYRIERLVTVPSLMATLLRAIPDIGEKLCYLRYCSLSGERLTTQLADEVSTALPGTVLLNLYGMSEASADATWYDDRWGLANDLYPIGRPLHNVHVYVLDSDGRPVPVGEPGEIHIGGVGLAKGYLGRPDLTAERFVPDPFVDDPDARMYRSGDLGRLRPDGVLEFIGRVDQQVKIRGVRIELGDIEAAARSLEEIAEAVVTAPEFGSDRRLVAYLVPAPGATATPTAIRGALATRLPDHMLPARISILDRFPLTPSGKIDRSALPDPIGERPAGDTPYAQPRTDTEQSLVEIWQELLLMDGVGVNDCFFDLGGDSLLVVLLQAQLRSRLGVALAVPTFFEHRTIRQLAAHIEEQREHPAGPREDESPAGPEQQQPSTTGTDVAIIGMAGRFPGSSDLERFWDNLANGVEGLRRLTDEELRTWEPNYKQKARDDDFVPVVGTLDDVEMFDADFFGIQPGEARTIDPQHRVWYETAWAALENAGYAPGKSDLRIGVFAGSYMNTYAMHNLLHDRESIEEFVRLQGAGSLVQSFNNEPDYLPTRTSHLLDLRGPAVSVQTACSTSLVAVTLACRAIASGDCEMALAGGVTVLLPEAQGYYYQSGGIRSADGHCRPFDAAGTGTVFTSGVGAVLLKGLDQAVADGDNILAVIKGAAMNNDGAHKASYMAPSIDGQIDVITDAQRRAGIDPATIRLVETHGTATPLGDPIEVAALARAYQTNAAGSDRKIALGAVKSNIGHTDAAAGVAGLIKTVLALNHQAIPPTLHFERPNPEIDFDDTPFYVPSRLEPWPAGGEPRRAGVSSFGVGGTNAHVVLEEAPAAPVKASARPRHLLTLSARTESALATMRRALADRLEAHHPALADVSYTLACGRADLTYRSHVVASGIDEAVAALRDDDTAPAKLEMEAPDVVMMFPGQGSQFVGMGRELYEHEPTYRAAIDRCARVLEPLIGLDLRHVLYPADEADPAMAEQLTGTGLAQPAIFAVSYAVAQLWFSWGVQPATLVGHSVGEYVAAVLAGVFTLEDALKIIASRASLMQSLPGGSMRAVRIPVDELAAHLGDGVSLAAINTPSSAVVSGPDDAMGRFEARMQAAGLETIELHTSHAFHSEMMDPILARFRDVIAGVERHAPEIPIISTVTGAPLTNAEAFDPDYWAMQVRRPVRFSDAVSRLHEEPGRVYLECGPGTTLSGAVRQHPNGTNGDARIAVVDSLGHPGKRLPALQPFLEGVGKLWQAGVPVDRIAAYGEERRRRVPLPTYPFERQRHWVDPPPLSANGATAARAAGSAEQIASPPVAPSPSTPDRSLKDQALGWAPVADELAAMVCRLGGMDASAIDRAADFADLGLDSLFLTQLSSQIRKQLGVRVRLAEMLEETPTIDSLAKRIEPAVATTIAAPASAPKAAPHSDPPTNGHQPQIIPTAPPAGSNRHATPASSDDVEALIAKQLRVMDQQLDLLAAFAGAAEAPTKER
jgi:amino acid adenylation domain-containing protein